MILNFLFTVLGVFALVYFESILLSLFGLRLFVILFYFLLKKIDWAFFFPASAVILLVFDVVYKLPLGSNILIFILPFALFLLLSLFVTLETGLFSFFGKILIFWFYYFLLVILPNLFESGELGFVSINDLLIALLRAVLSVLILLLLEYMYASFRKRGNTSQIRLK